ncbi:hypothetical protein LUZ60_003194 [Juncus effusus]|nr:hypothetical protein LUZ60_003194 [Juncus effusus]
MAAPAHLFPFSSSKTSLSLSPSQISTLRPSIKKFVPNSSVAFPSSSRSALSFRSTTETRPGKRPFICRMAEYQFPRPIPAFAEQETGKFREHMIWRLNNKKQYFGNSVNTIVKICTSILRKFLHLQYGGPGTLMVVPFIDMADTIRARNLPGGDRAARAAVVWAQNNLDKDWKKWTGTGDDDQEA